LSQQQTNITVTNFVYRINKRHSVAEQQWYCTALTLSISHTQNAVDGCMTPVTQSQYLQSPYYQPAVPYTHSVTLTL